ncbi:MAG: ABC transporter permease [Flavobacteriaceae bacterium]|nr:ABC transporter permease [Flavobacteriaceae bacterium]
MELKYIIKTIAAEWLKIKNLGLVYLAIIIGLFVPALVLVSSVFIETMQQYSGIEKSAVMNSIERNLSAFGGFFLLLFIIIAATRIAQTDHKNNGWIFMESQPVSRLSIYTGKFITLVFLSIIAILSYLIFSIIISLLSKVIFEQENLSTQIPVAWLFHTFIRLFVACLGIISLQMMLSILIRGFIWPFLIGVFGLIVNFAGLLRKETYDYFVYNNLSTSLSISNSSQLNSYFNYTEYLSVMWAALFFVIGYLFYSRRGFKNAFIKTPKAIIFSCIGLLFFGGMYYFITKPNYPHKLENKTIIEGKIKSNTPIEKAILYTYSLNEKVAEIPIENGKFYWETQDDISFEPYFLDFNKKNYAFILSKGDHIQLNVNNDPINFSVDMKGSRKAEKEFQNMAQQENSYFYWYIVNGKKFTNEPEKFYQEAKKEWESNKKFIKNYRTHENIYFSEDFRSAKIQEAAVKMLDAIADYQRMTSTSDTKFAPPQAFKEELETLLMQPEHILLISDSYNQWKLKSLLPQQGSHNPDSIIFNELVKLPAGNQKDNLLKNQLLNFFNKTHNEAERNQIFSTYQTHFQDKKYVDFIQNELIVINNQQKGKAMPQLILEDESGASSGLDKFLGKFVVIDFWATWCAPCKISSPVFEHQARLYKSLDDIVFLAVSVDEDKQKWELDIKNKSSNVSQFWLKNQSVLPQMGINQIPRFILIDKEGKIYNAKMPNPQESNFEEILNQLSTTSIFSVEF